MSIPPTIVKYEGMVGMLNDASLRIEVILDWLRCWRSVTTPVSFSSVLTLTTPSLIFQSALT